ncbi:tRNA (adenine(58)-N(1))-methyltransferase non-catalytic subunit TRM6 [Branchiostoma belcheri]|nr:tRNA (adenine(58)-N(1))-methyltransferase non-catalytic subunit TRM6 [Branchiostoma belcheri]
MIAEGDQVLIQKANVFRLVKVERRKKIFTEKLQFFLDSAVGLPLGSKFEVRNKQLFQVPHDAGADQLPSEAEVDTDRNNEKIQDDNRSQKLTKEDLAEMAKQGAKGEEIIEKLAQNNANFKEKTSFSQAKYLRKKGKKYLNYIIIHRPTLRLLCNMYMAKSPSKICHLRVDTLSQMLTVGNVHAHSRVMVVDSCQGLVLGAGCGGGQLPGAGPGGGHGEDGRVVVVDSCQGLVLGADLVLWCRCIMETSRSDMFLLLQDLVLWCRCITYGDFPFRHVPIVAGLGTLVQVYHGDFPFRHVPIVAGLGTLVQVYHGDFPFRHVPIVAGLGTLVQVYHGDFPFRHVPIVAGLGTLVQVYHGDFPFRHVPIVAGLGTLVQVYHGDFPFRHAYDAFNFPASFDEMLLPFPMSQLCCLHGPPSAQEGQGSGVRVQEGLRPGGQESNGEDSTGQEARKAPGVEEQKADSISAPRTDQLLAQGGSEADGTCTADKARSPDTEANVKAETLTDTADATGSTRKRLPWKEYKKVADRVFICPVADSVFICPVAGRLLIACKFHPSRLLEALLPCLAPSRTFAVYCQHREPLVDCYTRLRTSGGVLNLQLTETWLRNFQILPGRTRPDMQMSGTGGYLLSGITVATETDSATSTTEHPVAMATDSASSTTEPPVTVATDPAHSTTEPPVAMETDSISSTTEPPFTMATDSASSTTEPPVTVATDPAHSTTEPPVTMGTEPPVKKIKLEAD